jgi:hypothetical protein
VVLVGPDAGRLALARQQLAAGHDRIALLVGDPGDPLVGSAAAVMAAELFGPDGVVMNVDHTA